MSNVTLKNVVKSYQDNNIIKNINLEVNSGELIVFVGPSGCGKSTLLRMIAGLEELTDGAVFIDETEVSDIDPSQRGVAMVFQSYALYPHMNIYNNIAFSLKMAKVSKAEIDEKVRHTAEILQITNLLDYLPKQLSGGQRQRVAIGRAIIRNPKVFLFDEPLSNLDASLRIQMRIEIEKLHKDINTTMIYVTHDQVEAMTLADRVVVLNAGNIEQVDTPTEIYNNPKNLFVAGFIGNAKMNFIDVTGNNNMIEFENNKTLSFTKPLPNENLTLGIRPEDVVITNSESYVLNGRIDIVENLGECKLLYVQLSSDKIVRIKDTSNNDYQHNDEIYFGFDVNKAHIFNESGVNIKFT